MRHQGPGTERSARARPEEEGGLRTQTGPPYLSGAHQVPHHAAPQHGQRLVVEVGRAHAWGRSSRLRQSPALRAAGRRRGAGGSGRAKGAGARPSWPLLTCDAVHQHLPLM